ncbi:hypothetical protein [Desertivirga brevis]|uniref:hypothetical protein n=1 Tax=Desertivirga brevis TaxID=2810310 RepID=UPI001A95DAFE|nr:hypothetical protein [Pedobacter sp. SYSU D00873]
MSDKEFDKQFRDKFEDFEFEPSAFVWADIENELTASRKRTFPWFSVAAASMAAVIAAGIWFAPHKQPMKLYSKLKTEHKDTALRQQPTNSVTPAFADLETKEVPALAESISSAPEKLTRIEVKRGKAPNIRVVEPAVNEQGSPDLSNASDAHQEEVVSITAASVPTEVFSAKTEPPTVLAFHTLPEDTTSERSRYKIRSVGDLVNFVVSKVDKRKNKIIEFSKDDEGEEISGLNLGVLQYRTRNN